MSEKIWSPGLPDIGARNPGTSWFWQLVQALYKWGLFLFLEQECEDAGKTENQDAEETKSDSEDTPNIVIAPEITSPLCEIDTDQGTSLQQTESSTSQEEE